jgi:hypothetical protein
MKLAALSVLLMLAGCSTRALFTCQADHQCNPGQRCVDGACAAPDASCPSGWRFDPSAKMGAVCVPAEGADLAMMSMPAPPDDMAKGQGCGSCDMATAAPDLAMGIGLGGQCSIDVQCASGHCFDGVCCSVPSCAPCNACGGDGQCHPKVANAVDSRCTAQDPSTCGMTGHCDGAGACAFYGTSTVCDAPHCDAVDPKAKHPNTTYCSGGGAPCSPVVQECTVTQGTVKCCVDKSGNVGCCASL